MWNNFKDGFQRGLGCVCALLLVKCTIAVIRDLGIHFGILEPDGTVKNVDA